MAGDVGSCHAQPGRMALGCKWRVGGEEEEKRGGMQQAEARVKKSRAWGLVGGLVHVFFFFFSSRFPLVFSERTPQSVDSDGMSADRVQGARLVFSSACIVCIISSHCSAEALII